MTTIVTRTGKGSPLTHVEVDTNFTNLNTNKLEAGAIALGSAATPSISFTGDTNTGIYSPGADQVAVATNGTEKLIVLSNGNVGIGTSAPDVLLHSRITGGGGVPATSGTSQPNAVIRIGGSSTAGVLDIGCNSDAPWIQSTDRTDLSQKYKLLLNPNGGNVGIGVTSPGGTLDIKAAASTHPLIVQGPSSEFARVDSSGRLLIGTSSARANFYNSTNSARFQIEGSGSNDNYALSIVSNFAGNTSGAQVILAKSGGSSVGDNTLVSNGNTIGQINFQGADGTELVEAASIRAEVDGTPGANDMPGRLVFSTTADGASSPTEAMRIDNQRNILAGGATDANAGSGVGIKILSSVRMQLGVTDSTNSSIGYSMYSTNAAAYRFYVGFGGTIFATSTTISAISDRRLKENIKDLDAGLNAILALKPRKFDWKEGFGNTGKNVRGFIAQEVEEIFPDLIDEWEKGENHPEGEEPYKSVRQDLIPVLVKAIQEQQVMIAELQTEVAALKGA